MRVPEVQDELRALAQAHNMPRLGELADALSRRSPDRVGRVVSNPVTPEVRRAIRALADADPDLTQVEIGQRFGVNPGRVSEALRGKRH